MRRGPAVSDIEAARRPAGRIAELRSVTVGVGQADLEPIDRHQPPPPSHAPGSASSQRGGNLLEHLRQHLGPEPFRARVIPEAVGTDHAASQHPHLDNDPVTFVATSL